MKIYVVLLFLVFSTLMCRGQYLVSMHAAYDDSFATWYLYTDLDEEITLDLKRRFNQDWSEWEYEYDGIYGEIRQKWKDNPNWWELRAGDETYTIKTMWKNDFDQWRIDGEGLRYNLESKYSNYTGEWSIRKTKTSGSFDILQEFRNDPRDWVIDDYLPEGTSIHARIGLAFLAMFNSLPRQ